MLHVWEAARWLRLAQAWYTQQQLTEHNGVHDLYVFSVNVIPEAVVVAPAHVTQRHSDIAERFYGLISYTVCYRVKLVSPSASA